jgi:hypothetical protein
MSARASPPAPRAGKLLRLYWQPMALAEELAGSFADLLQQIANIKPLEDPTRHFVVIMKDGKIFKNTLTKSAPSSTTPSLPW